MTSSRFPSPREQDTSALLVRERLSGHSRCAALACSPIDPANAGDSRAGAKALCVGDLVIEPGATLNTNGLGVYEGASDGVDVAPLLSAWGQSNPAAEIDGEGVVDGADLATLLAAWGACAD